MESEAVSASEYLGVDFGGHNVLGVNRTSAGGDVLGFTYSAFDATGVEHGYPAIVVLDSPLVGIDSIEADSVSEVVVITRQGSIEVVGGEECSIYDLNGVRVGSSKADGLASGVYVVTFDGKSRKVSVR